MAKGDAICQEHGVERHVAVHESGHAVAALALGLDFVRLVIHPAGTFLGQIAAGDEFVPGYLEPIEADPRDWVASIKEDALDMLLAGSVSERWLLGHELPRGFDGDVLVFKRGLGVSCFDSDEASRLIRLSLQRLDARRPTLAPAVTKLADEIGTRLKTSPSDSVLMSRSEIEQVLGGLCVQGSLP